MKKIWWFVIVLTALLPLVWYLASPLFIDKVVNEKNPMVSDNSSLVYQGVFSGADSFHQVKGKALVLSSEGKRYLRIENFESTNGPDLKVYLSKDLDAKDYVNLGNLKGNIGNQNYEVPESVNLEDYNYVLIWCERFGVLFGHADLN